MGLLLTALHSYPPALGGQSIFTALLSLDATEKIS